MQEEREALLEALGQALREQVWYGSRRFMSFSEEAGLTMPQAMVLEVLENHEGPCPMQKLSALTSMSAAVLTGIIDRMLKSGLVTREVDGHDRRVVAIALTEQGMTRTQEEKECCRMSLAADAQTLTNEEIQQFTALLQKFSQGMKTSMTVPKAAQAS